MAFERLFRYYAYMKRGYQNYIVFIVALLNFVVIQYRLLVDYVPALKTIFPNLLSFAIFAILCLAPVTIIIGWLDYRRGVYQQEMRVMGRYSPWHSEVLERIRRIEEKVEKLEQVIEEKEAKR